MELDNSAIGLIIIILTLVTVMFVVFTNYNEINYLKTKIDKLTAITNELSAASEVVTEICSTIEDEEIDNYQGTGEEYIENLEELIQERKNEIETTKNRTKISRFSIYE